MSSSPRLPKGPAGMTLVELMIVLVVLSVLAALAWPAYQSAVQRSRRADGMAALTEIMQAQERWRANNPSYKASLTAVAANSETNTRAEPALPGTRTESQNGHYALALTNVSSSTYTAAATVISSAQAGDTRCQVLLVRVNGGNITYASKASADGADNSAPDPCWSR